jgi:DNA (cytosine-5)-methyltransferase 1
MVSPTASPELARGSGINAIDLFAGFGGLTLGSEQAGVPVVWAGNHWQTAVDTHARNHPRTVHVCQDLRQTDWTTLPAFRIQLAAPACQGHSPASQPKRRVFHDAVRATAFAVIDCADVTEPEAIIVENVPAFTRWRLYPWWREGLERLGYQLDTRIVTASHLGVAQRRTRLFIIATRPGVKVRPLRYDAVEPAFGQHLHRAVDEHLWRPVSAATPAVRARIEHGRTLHGSRFLTQHVTGHPGVGLNEPIRTITTASQHWNLVDGDRYRALSARELARGMGFPDTYTWDPGLSTADVTKGLGNSVCPPVGREIVSAVAEAIG